MFKEIIGGGGRGPVSCRIKYSAIHFSLAHIIKAPCVQEVCHKSPGSAITSETWPSVVRMMAMVCNGSGGGSDDDGGGGGGGRGGDGDSVMVVVVAG